VATHREADVQHEGHL